MHGLKSRSGLKVLKLKVCFLLLHLGLIFHQKLVSRHLLATTLLTTNPASNWAEQDQLFSRVATHWYHHISGPGERFLVLVLVLEHERNYLKKTGISSPP